MAGQEDEKTPLEAEILREVAEEMKEEQLKQLWKKISPIITVLILVALLVTGGIEYHKYYQNQQSLKETKQFETALTLIEQGKGEEGAAILKDLSVSSSRGYRYLAAFQYADFLLGQGKDKLNDAIKTMDIVINDENAPNPFKNMALFNKINLQIENGNQNYTEMEKELERLFTQSDAWTPLALEVSASLALRQGDVEKAKSRWQQILGMANISEAKRKQVSEYISFVEDAPAMQKQK